MVICSVIGCRSRQGERSFFRCPKEKARCESWKRALGFVGTHKYSHLSPEQCCSRIKICDLHFPKTSLMINNSKTRLQYNAVPSLNLFRSKSRYEEICGRFLMKKDDFLLPLWDILNVIMNIILKQFEITNANKEILVKSRIDHLNEEKDASNGTEKAEVTCKSVSLQTEATEDDYGRSCKDVSLQTYVFTRSTYTFTKHIGAVINQPVLYLFTNLDKHTQTIRALYMNIPNMQKVKREIPTEDPESGTSSKKRKCQETEITVEDIQKYLETKYSEQSCKLLKTQLNLLNKSARGCGYSEEFKAFALSLYFLGPKTYKQFSSLHQLPSRKTLDRFTRKWTINPGFNDFIFRLLQLWAKLFKENEKDCVICLDEVALKSTLFYDISRDKIVGFQADNTKVATTVLVVMVRGIASNWKQPIAYFFHSPSASAEKMKEILFASVRRLTAIDFNVVAVVSNHRPNFRKLVKVLKVTPENIFFFVDNARLVYIFDVPGLLISTRNSFFSYNFVLPEGTAKKCYLDAFYDHDKDKACRLCPKLTNEHLSPHKSTNLEEVLQIFNHSVAAAIQAYIDFKILPPEASVTAKFIRTFTDLFDLLNSSQSNVNAFAGKEKQLKFLERIENAFNSTSVTNQTYLIYGWRLTVRSIEALWEILKYMRSACLLTRNLNRACTENFFEQIRRCCGRPGNPTAIKFSRAFKKLFILNQAEGTNPVDDINEVLLKTGELLESCKTIIRGPPRDNPLTVFTNDYRNIYSTDDHVSVDVINYLLKKSLLRHSCDVCLSYSVQNGLNVSSSNVLQFMVKLENTFVEKFVEMACQNRIGQKLKALCKNVPFAHPCTNFPFEYFISLYVRTRIYFTLKFANYDIKSQIRRNKTIPNINLRILRTL